MFAHVKHAGGEACLLAIPHTGNQPHVHAHCGWVNAGQYVSIVNVSVPEFSMNARRPPGLSHFDVVEVRFKLELEHMFIGGSVGRLAGSLHDGTQTALPCLSIAQVFWDNFG